MNMNPKKKMTPDPAPKSIPATTITELSVDVVISDVAWIKTCAEAESLCKKAAETGFLMALADGITVVSPHAEVAIVLGDDQNIHDLNRDYRGIDKPTNVLSFASMDSSLDGASPDPLPEGAPLLLGDIIVAFETVEREAAEENKTLQDHLSHMIVHGVLHLMGYDHETETDAVEMETLEIKTLSELGISNPYMSDESVRP
jgi:probable rRNA maturation factor